jgi:hypothetical protein
MEIVQVESPGSLQTFLESFGAIQILDELNGDRIHGLENIISMCGDAQYTFPRLILWLEPVVCLLKSTTRRIVC